MINKVPVLVYRPATLETRRELEIVCANLGETFQEFLDISVKHRLWHLQDNTKRKMEATRHDRKNRKH